MMVMFAHVILYSDPFGSMYIACGASERENRDKNFSMKKGIHGMIVDT